MDVIGQILLKFCMDFTLKRCQKKRYERVDDILQEFISKWRKSGELKIWLL